MSSDHAAKVALCRYFRRGFDPSANSTGGLVRQTHSTAGAVQQRNDRQRDAKQASATSLRGRSSGGTSAVARDRHGHVSSPSQRLPPSQLYRALLLLTVIARLPPGSFDHNNGRLDSPDQWRSGLINGVT